MARSKSYRDLDIPTKKDNVFCTNGHLSWNYIESTNESISRFISVVLDPDNYYKYRWQKKVYILDVGCGLGRTLLKIKSKLKERLGAEELALFRFMGIEVQPELVDMAQSTFPGAIIYNADACLTELPYRMADFIYLYRPIYGSYEYKALLTKIWGLMKPGAILYQADMEEIPDGVYRDEMKTVYRNPYHSVFKKGPKRYPVDIIGPY